MNVGDGQQQEQVVEKREATEEECMEYLFVKGFTEGYGGLNGVYRKKSMNHKLPAFKKCEEM